MTLMRTSRVLGSKSLVLNILVSGFDHQTFGEVAEGPSLHQQEAHHQRGDPWEGEIHLQLLMWWNHCLTVCLFAVRPSTTSWPQWRTLQASRGITTGETSESHNRLHLHQSDVTETFMTSCLCVKPGGNSLIRTTWASCCWGSRSTGRASCGRPTRRSTSETPSASSTR